MIARKDSTIAAWRDAVPLLLLGFSMSLVQLAIIGAIRYAMTGTLDGIPLPS
jgi:hypothetical protein